MDNKKVFIVSKKIALEIIDSEICTICKSDDLEYAVVTDDEKGKYLRRNCKACGSVIEFSLNK